MRVPRPAWTASRSVRLSMRDTQPPLGHGVLHESVESVKVHCVARASELVHDRKEIEVIAIGGRHPELERHRSAELGVAREAMHEPRMIPPAPARRSIAYGCRIWKRLPSELSTLRVEVERRVSDRGKRPARLEAYVVVLASLSHLEAHARRALPPVIL